MCPGLLHALTFTGSCAIGVQVAPPRRQARIHHLGAAVLCCLWARVSLGGGLLLKKEGPQEGPPPKESPSEAEPRGIVFWVAGMGQLEEGGRWLGRKKVE